MMYLFESIGRNGISARVVAASVSAYNPNRKLTTIEYEGARSTLAEQNTHHIMCQNAESTRAVPTLSRIERMRNSPFIPVHWGKNQAGMVAEQETDALVYGLPPEEAYRQLAKKISDEMHAWHLAGYHKQIVNRIGENFLTIKGVITATEWDNYLHLRTAPDADPSIRELALCIQQCILWLEENNAYEVLSVDDWHTPYVKHERVEDSDELLYYIEGSSGERTYLDVEEAKRTSAVCCGQVSFRKLDPSPETVDRVWHRLLGGDTIHASVVQHQATPMAFSTLGEFVEFAPDVDDFNLFDTPKIIKECGATHLDAEGSFWSAQLKGFTMFRKTIDGESNRDFIDRLLEGEVDKDAAILH